MADYQGVSIPHNNLLCNKDYNLSWTCTLDYTAMIPQRDICMSESGGQQAGEFDAIAAKYAKAVTSNKTYQGHLIECYLKACEAHVVPLKEKEIRGDRMIVDLEHQKTVLTKDNQRLSGKIKELEEKLEFEIGVANAQAKIAIELSEENDELHKKIKKLEDQLKLHV